MFLEDTFVNNIVSKALDDYFVNVAKGKFEDLCGMKRNFHRQLRKGLVQHINEYESAYLVDDAEKYLPEHAEFLYRDLLLNESKGIINKLHEESWADVILRNDKSNLNLAWAKTTMTELRKRSISKDRVMQFINTIVKADKPITTKWLFMCVSRKFMYVPIEDGMKMPTMLKEDLGGLGVYGIVDLEKGTYKNKARRTVFGLVEKASKA